jgi:formylglycine-generating enzyme required for sulfatase activity
MNVRLPTEAEWQLAATGGDLARIWPWGRDWDPEKETWRANTAESGLRRTLPAGFYPLGASPVGVMDMAGNLWEWCLDAFGAARRGSPDPQPARVVRGGSWLNDQGLARSVSLNGFDSDFRYSNVGFRVVYSSASS